MSLLIAAIGLKKAKILFFFFIPSVIFATLFTVFLKRLLSEQDNSIMYILESIGLSFLTSAMTGGLLTSLSVMLYMKHKENYRKGTSPYVDYKKIIIGEDKENTNIQQALQSLVDFVSVINQNHLLVKDCTKELINTQYQYLMRIAKSEICCGYDTTYKNTTTPLYEDDGQIKISVSCDNNECRKEKPYNIDDLLIGKYTEELLDITIARIAGDNVQIYRNLFFNAPSLLTESVIDGFELRHKMFANLYCILHQIRTDWLKSHFRKQTADPENTENWVLDTLPYDRAFHFLGSSNSIKVHYNNHNIKGSEE
jgi:hypothetical protein